MVKVFKNKKNPAKLDKKAKRQDQQQESDDEEYENNQVIEDVPEHSDSEPEMMSSDYKQRREAESLPQHGQQEKEDQWNEVSEAAKLRERIQSMPLGQVEQLKKKLGVKLFNKTFFGEETTSSKPHKKETVEARNSMTKSMPNPESKNKEKKNPKRPREVSSKKPVTKFRRVIEVKKKERFDPRFSEQAGGDFDDAKFRKDYSFLNDIKRAEILELKKAYRSTRHEDPEKAARIRTNILRLENQLKSARDADLMQALRAELRKTNIERMNQGQRPLLLNNKEMKRRFMEKKIGASSSSNGNLRPYLHRKLERFNEKQQQSSDPKNTSFSSSD